MIKKERLDEITQVCKAAAGVYYTYNADSKFFMMAKEAIPELIANYEEQAEEIKQLKETIKNLLTLNLAGIGFDNEAMNIKMNGIGAQIFMQFVIDLFKANGGENFLTFGVGDSEHQYSITVQNCDGTITPALKLELLEQVAEMAGNVVSCATSINSERYYVPSGVMDLLEQALAALKGGE